MIKKEVEEYANSLGIRKYLKGYQELQLKATREGIAMNVHYHHDAEHGDLVSATVLVGKEPVVFNAHEKMSGLHNDTTLAACRELLEKQIS